MNRKLFFTCLACIAALGAVPAAAHHAAQAQFDVTKTVEATGVLTKIEWLNPHSWFHFDVKGKDGQVASWAFETPGPLALRKVGLTKTGVFKIGETYTVNFHPARNGKNQGILRTIVTPAGQKIGIGQIVDYKGGK